MRRVTGLLTAAVLLGSALAGPVAQADTGIAKKEHSTPYRAMKMTGARVVSTKSAVTAVVGIRNLKPHEANISLDLDTGFADKGNVSWHHWQVGVPVPKSRKRRVVRPTVRLVTSGRHDQPGWLAPCRGARAELLWAKGTVRIRVPHTCLGKDAGMVRATVEWWHACECDTPGARLRTRVLQQGKRGAAYSDVNGDGRPDRVTQSSPTPDSYRVRVDLGGGRVLTATAPRLADVPWAAAKPWSVIDLDRDGRAEVIGNPGDAMGAESYHVFRLVKGALRLVRTADGKPLELWHTSVGADVYSDFRCSTGGLQTWRLVDARGDGPRYYDLAVTSWRLNAAVAKPATRNVPNVLSSFASAGNWSAGSCRIG